MIRGPGTLLQRSCLAGEAQGTGICPRLSVANGTSRAWLRLAQSPSCVLFPASFRPPCSGQNNGRTVTCGFSAGGGVDPRFLLLLPRCCAALALTGPLLSALPAFRCQLCGEIRGNRENREGGHLPRLAQPSLANQGPVSRSEHRLAERFLVCKMVQSGRPPRGRRGPDRRRDLPSIPVSKAGKGASAPGQAELQALPGQLFYFLSLGSLEPGQAGGSPGTCPAILQLCELKHIPCPLCAGGNAGGEVGLCLGHDVCSPRPPLSPPCREKHHPPGALQEVL